MKLDEIQGSTTFRKLNAALFAALAARPAQGAEPSRRSHSTDCRLDGPAPRLGYRVTITQFRRRLLDGHDSLAFAVKPIVDEIGVFLGYPNDSDPALHWEYGQQETRGEEGVIVKIQPL